MGGGSSLPYDAEIEYLQGTGTQYIDTGYKPKDNTELQINYVVTKLHSRLSNPLTPYGCRVGWLNKQYCIFSPANKVNECHISYGDVDERLDGVTVLNQDITVYANSNVVTFGSITKSFQTGNLPNLNIFLFGLNNNGSLFSVNGFELNIKSFWIKEGGQFIIDMIPVRVGQVGYLYDKVGRTLCGNSGTGSFTLGPDKT